MRHHPHPGPTPTPTPTLTPTPNPTLALTRCAIILTALLDNLLFGGPLNLPIAASAAIILASIVNYSEGA